MNHEKLAWAGIDARPNTADEVAAAVACLTRHDALDVAEMLGLDGAA